MSVDLSRLDPRGRALWAKVVTTAIAAGESQDAAEAIASKGLANAGLLDSTMTPRDLSIAKTKEGLKVRIPVVAAVKGPKGSLDVFGWGSVAVDEAGRLVVDHQADIIEAPELEAAVYDFAKNAGSVDVQHGREPVGDLIESAFFDPRKRVAMGLDGSGRVGWWAGFRVTDPATIKSIEGGELPEFSINATAIRDVLPADQVTKSKTGGAPQVGRLRQIKLHLLSLVTAGAGKGVTVELWKAKEAAKMTDTKTEKAMPLAEIVAAIKELPPEDRAKLLSALQPQQDEPPPGADTPAAKALAETLKARDVEIAKAKAAADEAMAEVRKMREAETDRVAIAKAKADGLEYMPGDLAAIVKSVRAAKAADEKAGAALETAMIAAAKALKESGILKSVGATGGGEGSTTFEALYAAEKAKNPTEDVGKLMSRLSKAHPELYKNRGGN